MLYYYLYAQSEGESADGSRPSPMGGLSPTPISVKLLQTCSKFTTKCSTINTKCSTITKFTIKMLYYYLYERGEGESPEGRRPSPMGGLSPTPTLSLTLTHTHTHTHCLFRILSLSVTSVPWESAPTTAPTPSFFFISFLLLSIQVLEGPCA